MKTRLFGVNRKGKRITIPVSSRQALLFRSFVLCGHYDIAIERHFVQNITIIIILILRGRRAKFMVPNLASCGPSSIIGKLIFIFQVDKALID